MMSIPMPMDTTMVALMSTAPRFPMTCWKTGAEIILTARADSIAAAIPAAMLPDHCMTSQAAYIENTTAAGKEK
jgi:hypothetical protein